MAQHVVDRPLEADRVEGDESQDREAHVADRGVRDELLDVGLDPADEGGVDDADHREDADRRSPFDDRQRDHRQDEDVEAVEAELQDDRGEVHRARSGGLVVGQGQPGVQREERDLHREAGEEGQQDPALFGRRERRGERGEVGDRERPFAVLFGVLPGHVGQGQQHEQRADEGVDEELERCLASFRPPVDREHEEARHQRGFEEGVERDRVTGDEDARDAGRQDHQPDVELAAAFGDRGPGTEHAGRHQEHVEQHQQQGDRVHPEDESEADPRQHRELILDLFEARPVEPLIRGPVGELQRDHHRPGEGGERASQRDGSGISLAGEADDAGGHQGQKQKDPETHPNPPRIQTQTTHASTRATPPAMEAP